VARTAKQHQANGIDVRMRIEAESLDLDTQTIKTRNVDTGTPEEATDHHRRTTQPDCPVYTRGLVAKLAAELPRRRSA
jgi:hypothetical protein